MDGDALNRVIEDNVGLVYYMANKYQRYCAGGLEVEDLVQAGVLGLRRAAQKFRPELGNRFSTYACIWIRQAITRCIAEHARTVTVPVWISERINLITRAERALEIRLGRRVTLSELAAETGLSEGQIQQARHGALPTMESVDELVALAREQEKLSEPATALDSAARAEMNDAIDAALATLKPREQMVLRMRFGLAGEWPLTLREIGGLLGVTPEAIRQTETVALRKLRRKAPRAMLAPMLEVV